METKKINKKNCMNQINENTYKRFKQFILVFN